MNELMISFINGGFVYYATNQFNASEAFYEFLQTCENSGINVDNVPFDKAILRDQDGHDIDTWRYMESSYLNYR